MRYLVGLNLPMKSRCHESGVALIDGDGKILFAMNEERLSRKKLDGDFPTRSIEAMLKQSGVDPKDVSHVAVPAVGGLQRYMRFAEFLWRERLVWLWDPRNWGALFGIFIKEKNARKVVGEQQGTFVMQYYWRDFINTRFPNAQIVQVDHHTAHAAGAYYTSPWADALVVTIDGAGNLLSSVIAEGTGGVLKIIDNTFIPHSLGSFWGSVTKVCGFASGTRHGGKVTGLAALGNPAKLIEVFRTIIRAQGMRVRMQEDVFFAKKLIPDWGAYEPDRLRALVGDASREDVAAAAQMRLEEVACEMVKNARKVSPHSKLVCAGGVFGNVRMNQKILELPEADDIYIFPAMSDGGLALGAALYTLAQQKKLMPHALETPYLGPAYSDEETEKYLKEKGATYAREENLPKKLAELLAADKVLALSHGRMEYGPRALGNRTMMYAAKDPKVNDWLNRRLNRSEFMPFAPVTLREHIQEMYVGIAPNPVAAKYMTVTYECTARMKAESPACVHVDGSARPQVISRVQNPFYYDVLSEYYKITGIPTLINTSFNMHEEPIVCSPDDSLRAFLASGVDYLCLGPFLLSFEDNKQIKEKVLQV
jgi:carbamoyltransferase